MTLTTIGDLAPAPPVGGGRHGVGGRLLLEDVSADRVLFHLQGRAGDALQRALGDAPASPGNVVEAGSAIVACLRPDQFLLLVQPADASDLAGTLRANADVPLTLTDITHGRAVLRLSGHMALSVLPKLCGLNFRREAFPDLHAAPTSYAKVRAVIIRHDLHDSNGDTPSCFLVVGRSVAEYVWEVTVDAMGEFLDGR